MAINLSSCDFETLTMAAGSSIPQFFQPLTPSFLTNFCIPKSFLKHLSSNDFVAVLKDRSDSGDKAWLVKVDGDGSRFMDGWKEFAQDHGLRVGDFLTFRYLGGFVFDVLVFDPVTACERSLSADRLIESRSGHSEINDQISECEPVLILNGDSSETNGHLTEKSEDPSSEGHVVCKETSHCTEKDVTGERVEFKPSRYPYFRTSVKQYSFTWHATLIPTDFARKNNLAKRWCEMTIIDQKDRSWPVNLRYRKVGKDQVYLASGWDKLRDAHELKVGDSMVFELINSGTHPLMKFYKLS